MIRLTYTACDSTHTLQKKLREAFDNQYTGCVLALGFFDGVHIAHRALLRIARERAHTLSLPLVVFTFSGESSALKCGARRLYSDEEKLSLLEECGADAVIIADFEAVAELDKFSFVKSFIAEALDVRVAAVGYNFRFGKGALGTSDDLKSSMQALGRDAVIVERLTDNGEPISSTRIRELLGERSLREAARLLGKPYFLTGKVTHGLGLGKSFGIPTVNTELPTMNFSPPNGVYLSALSVGGKRYVALTNVGVCPTFGERSAHAETFILDFDGDLYGKNIRVYLLDYLREEKKFSSEAELAEQIKLDTARALSLAKEIKWQEIGLS